MSFATKLCHVVYADGTAHDVMKHPATDKGKISLPGVWCGVVKCCIVGWRSVRTLLLVLTHVMSAVGS
jgi:hypothetical protein